MNTYNVNDENFINSQIYQNFINANSASGMLKIRAFAAREAIPIAGLKVTVSKIVDNNKIIFSEGYTDNSGMIEEISLPAPKLDESNLMAPNKITYDIEAIYLPNNTIYNYKVNIYEDICVIQIINIITDTLGDKNGS